MVPEVAQVLARLDQRAYFTGRDDLVFAERPAAISTALHYGGASRLRWSSLASRH